MSATGAHIYFAWRWLAAALCVFALHSLYTAATRRKDLPPGPKRALFFGNALQFPKLDQHLKMAEWARQYGMHLAVDGCRTLNASGLVAGEIVYAEFFGQPTIIINTLEAATQLMGKGGAKYSDKPRLVYLNELYVHSRASVHGDII